MPVYAYRCRACELEFEVRASFRDIEEGLAPECPRCRGHLVQRTMTVPLVIRRGAAKELPQRACCPDAAEGCSC